jgi:hypothetical protein
MLVLAEALFLDISDLAGEREWWLKSQILLPSFPVLERSNGYTLLGLFPEVAGCMTGRRD